MDITVIIPSRGRVRGLSAILASLKFLESGKHRVQYGVCCDEDDIATAMFCQTYQSELPHQFSYKIGPRPESLGGVINEMAGLMPADLYFMLTDHCLCLTPEWDDIAAKAAEETPHGIFFWTIVYPKLDGHFCIVTEKWRAADGRLMSEDYPFWFDDLALLEQYPLATGQGAMHLPIEMAFIPAKTHRMRDLKFWRDYFIFKRADRVERGKAIAEKLGLPIPAFGEAFAQALSELLPKASDEHLDYITNLNGDQSEPDASYLAAKAKAEQEMNQ